MKHHNLHKAPVYRLSRSIAGLIAFFILSPQIFSDIQGASASTVSNDYYVNPSGDDKSDGHSPATAWLSAGKVNSTKFSPGDHILFERGGEWHEQLIASSSGSPADPIVYADYGDANATKPTFWGSDVVPGAAFQTVEGSVYSFPISLLPTGKAYWVFADHNFFAAATSTSNMPAGSFFISDRMVYVQTGGIDPRNGKVVYTMTDRAYGVDANSSLICSNGHDNLIFTNLVGRETADVAPGGDLTHGIPDGYIFRIQGSVNVQLNNCEAINGGKHHIGVINSTGFVGTKLHAIGSVPGLSYGNAGAFVSFSDASRHGDTSRWIDCTVDHFDVSQMSFITHGQGLGNLLIQNLKSIGCGLGISTDGADEIVTIKGGLLTGPTCDIYGKGIVIDGLRLQGNAKIDLFGDKNIVQNCLDDQSTNNQGGIVCRGKDNIIRLNTLAHNQSAGFCIDIKKSSINTRVIGNIFAGTPLALNDEGSTGLILDYNLDDDQIGKPEGLGGDVHLVTGNPKFIDSAKGNYSLAADSPAVNRIPPLMIEGVFTDFLGNPRLVGASYDIGAFERQ